MQKIVSSKTSDFDRGKLKYFLGAGESYWYRSTIINGLDIGGGSVH